MSKHIILSLFVLALLTGCSHEGKQLLKKTESTDTFNYSEVEEQINNLEKETMDTQANDEVVKVIMKTSMGDITLELFKGVAPKTVQNFLDLAQKDFYDGILFHRVIPEFMIQAGDPNTKTDPKNWNTHGTGGPGYKFADEFNDIPLVQGSLAMANAGPNTNGSQFFIVTAGATPWLDGRHTNFGRVIDGMDVVLEIQNVEANDNDHPLKDVVIEDVVIVE